MFVRPFLFCFGFGSTLHPDNVAPFIGTLFMTCAQTQIMKKNEEKPSLPLKFLHIWQARIISFRQDKKKNNSLVFFLSFCYSNCLKQEFCIAKENRQCTPCLCPCHSSKNPETCWQTRNKTMFVHSPFALVSEAPSRHIETFLHLLVHRS